MVDAFDSDDDALMDRCEEGDWPLRSLRLAAARFPPLDFNQGNHQQGQLRSSIKVQTSLTRPVPSIDLKKNNISFQEQKDCGNRLTRLVY